MDPRDRGMRVLWVELSKDVPPLARAEAIAAAEALGGGRGPSGTYEDSGLPVPVELPDGTDPAYLTARLALARRCLERRGTTRAAAEIFARAGRDARSAAVRWIGRPTSGSDDRDVRELGRAYVAAGGRIDLEHPDRRFWLVGAPPDGPAFFEEVGATDPSALARRRMPRLPFQRPVSLPPRLARAAANLAGIRLGDRVLDPFVGTGALLAEAGLLGAEVYGIDRDPEMVRGALRNLGHLGVTPRSMVVGDAGDPAVDVEAGVFDAVLTDPPYGRASSTGGEGGAAVVARVLPRWAERVRPGGRVVVILGGPSVPLGPPWECCTAIPVRVHRSLTREFRVYRRPGATPSSG